MIYCRKRFSRHKPQLLIRLAMA